MNLQTRHVPKQTNERRLFGQKKMNCCFEDYLKQQFISIRID